jgi:excisionase family DNA binding protein
MKNGETLLTAKQVSELWNCSAYHVRQLAREGKLRSVRVGARATRFRPSDLAYYLALNSR